MTPLAVFACCLILLVVAASFYVVGWFNGFDSCSRIHDKIRGEE